MRTTAFILLLTVGVSLLSCKEHHNEPDPLEVETPLSNAAWTTTGSSSYGNAIETDKEGNVYVTGYYEAPSVSFGSSTLTAVGKLEGYAFLAKYNSNGSILWVRKISADIDGDVSLSSYGGCLVIDNTGNVYVGGYFGHAGDNSNPAITEKGSIYLVKYSAQGDLQWAKGGGTKATTSFIVSGLAVNEKGTLAVTGGFEGEVTIGPKTLVSAPSSIKFYGKRDGFVAAFNTDGNYLWAEKMGGDTDDFGTDVALDDQGNSYVTGTYGHKAEFGGIQISTDTWDEFVTKYNDKGAVQWVKALNTGSFANSRGIALDKDQNVYSATDKSIFKFDRNGSLQWNKDVITASDRTFMSALTISASGDIFVTGPFAETATIGGETITSKGSYDIFLARFSRDGTLNWVKRDGVSFQERPEDIVLTKKGNIYITGFVGGAEGSGTNQSVVLADTTLGVNSFGMFVARYNQ